MKSKPANETHAERPAAAAGEFKIGRDLRVNRLGYGAMRITGKGIWGELIHGGSCPRKGPMDEILDKLQTRSTTVERASKSKARYPRRRSADEADSCSIS
jgi:hypothetical protein